MKSILAIIIILFGLIPMSACTHTEIHNDYKPTRYKVSENLKIVFTMEVFVNDSVKGATVYGEPYTLIAGVLSGENIRSLSFRNMLMKSKSGGNKVLLSDKNITPLPCVNNKCEAAITFEIKNLEYEPYTLSGLIVLNGSSHEFTVELETDYKKQRVNKFWKELMGI